MSRPAVALLLLVLVGCSRADSTPPDVRVQAGGQDLTIRPTQYCLDGEGQRYEITPPIVEVPPDTQITLTVPDAVAARGWAVQVFDEELEETIGEVDVPEGESVFREINSSDVVPPAYYLVVVEDEGGDCGAFSAAWPVGVIRAGG